MEEALDVAMGFPRWYYCSTWGSYATWT